MDEPRESGRNWFRLKSIQEDKAQYGPAMKMNISFVGLSYSVKLGIFKEKKEILKGVNGEFKAGELTAIMGPSGAGKSSLMNALAGYTKVGVIGSVQTNGIEREMRTFCRKSSYILQDDVLPPMLRVDEAMHMAAKLKLGVGHPNVKKRVSKILKSLGLDKCEHVMSGELSGGQRKRLAIALELISDPPIMFFDEPTTGLDSSTSKKCISLMRKLAKTGRTIICTIHQPSALIFELFDHVYILSNGQCIYSGATTLMVPFFASQQLLCPQYHNPADFALEVAALEEYSTFIPNLISATNHGSSVLWRKIDKEVNEDDIDKEKIITSNEAFENGDLGTNKIRDRCTYAASFFTQFTTLILRNFVHLYRSQFHTYLRLAIHLSVGIVIGILFYGTGNQASHVRNNFGLAFFSIMFIMFTSYSSAATYFPLELPILAREHFNKWYSLKSYYLAANMSEIPVQLCCTLLYFSVIYLMTSQPMEIMRYFIASMTLVLVSLVGQSFGYLIGSSMSITNASIFGPFVTAPFILFSGFFVLVKDSPWYFEWLFKVSYFKYALHAVLQGLYGFQRARMPCNAVYCHYRTPSKFLQDVSMDDGNYLIDWSILLFITLLLRVLAYYSLIVQIRFLRK